MHHHYFEHGNMRLSWLRNLILLCCPFHMLESVWIELRPLHYPPAFGNLHKLSIAFTSRWPKANSFLLPFGNSPWFGESQPISEVPINRSNPVSHISVPLSLVHANLSAISLLVARLRLPSLSFHSPYFPWDKSSLIAEGVVGPFIRILVSIFFMSNPNRIPQGRAFEMRINISASLTISPAHFSAFLMLQLVKSWKKQQICEFRYYAKKRNEKYLIRTRVCYAQTIEL